MMLHRHVEVLKKDNADERDGIIADGEDVAVAGENEPAKRGRKRKIGPEND